MKILAFDTCFGACSAALVEADGAHVATKASRHAPMQRGHAEALLPMIEAVLADAGETCTSIDRIAVTQGPGTFTGVRVGVAAARSLALATGHPLVAVGTLEAMAGTIIACEENPIEDGPFAIAVDARRDQIYLQSFERRDDAAIPVMVGPIACDVSSALDALAKETRVLAGSGGPLIADGTSHLCVSPDLQPDAVAVARIAATREAANTPVSPLYLRPPDAKPQHAFALERTS